MLAYMDLGHYDDFETELVCWVEVSAVPEEFINEAKRIDGECYSDGCFGVCIHYDRKKEAFAPVPGKPGHELYYVDNNGDRHWFPYELDRQEVKLFVRNIRPAIGEHGLMEDRKAGQGK